MRKPVLLALLVLPVAAIAWPGENRFPSVSIGTKDYILYIDNLHNSYTAAQCLNLPANSNGTSACTILLTRRPLPDLVGTVLSRWTVLLHDAVSANSGCAFTLVSNTGDITTTTKPALGDDTEAGYTVITTGSPGYSETIPNSPTIAYGGWIQVRVDTLAGASAGDDGSCANASGIDVTVLVYAKR